MSSRFFGQYLLEKGRITSQQLLDALEYQKNITTPIGHHGSRARLDDGGTD
jgi:hypothetical protein